MTFILNFDLDLESLPKVKIFEAYQLRKTVKGEGEVNQNIKFKMSM